MTQTDAYDKIPDKAEEDDEETVDNEFLRIVRKRFDMAYDRNKHNRDNYIDDTKFATTDDQWPEDVTQLRNAGANSPRPKLTINKLNGTLKQINGDFRKNEIAIKVRPADNDADVKVAEIYDGLVRNIEAQSQADTAYTTAFECMSRGGFGAFRVITEYSNDDGFEQDIRIRRITNPLTIYFDPQSQELDRSDARFCFVTEMIDKEDFKELYPEVNLEEFEAKDEFTNWYSDTEVRIAEYWYKKAVIKKIALLSNDMTVDLDDKETSKALEMMAKDPLNPVTIIKEREVESLEIHFSKVCGNAVLERAKWVGKYIPIIPMYGEEVNNQGKTYYYGAIHHAKDAQRMYNYWKTTATEAIALTPKAPYLVTPEQIEGHEQQWAKANINNYPYLQFNNVQGMPPPQRATPPMVPQAELTMALGAADDIKACTGIYDASLGAQGNEKSGKAIRARQNQSDGSTFQMVDNAARAITYCGRILVDLIPRIYDTERVIRVIGADKSTEMVTINEETIDHQTGKKVILNDLSQGKYDVVVTTGLSYATQRLEAADGMMQFMQSNPQTAQFIMDLVAKNMDWPGAQEIADRLEKLLPPQLLSDSDDPKVQQQQQQAQAQQEQAQQAQQQQFQLEAQKEESKQQLEFAKLEVEKQKIQAENARTQLEHRKIEADTVKVNLEHHQALMSGAMNASPYIPQPTNQGY